MPIIWLWGGFGWLAALPRSRFEVRRSRFDVQPPAGTSNGGKPPAARLPQAWLILLGRAEAGGAPGILKVIPRESRNRNQFSLNAETQRARRNAEEKSTFLPLSLRSSANLCVSALILRRLRANRAGQRKGAKTQGFELNAKSQRGKAATEIKSALTQRRRGRGGTQRRRASSFLFLCVPQRISASLR